MATLSFRSSVVRSSAIPSPNAEKSLRKPSSAASPGWWTLRFVNSPVAEYNPAESPAPKKESPTEMKESAPAKFAPGCFTEEKARRFRMLTKDNDMFHDAMYHSAIATRLASESRDRNA